MEKESFESEEIAALMNDAFISIKVDREERPDIDHLYMSVCQMMREQCGWPLNVVMTPDAKPFYAATYIPPTSRFQVVGMDELVPRLKHAWENRRVDIDAAADQISGLIERAATAGANPAQAADSQISRELLAKAASRLANEFDDAHGGFGSAPKFPMPHTLLFLLQQWRRTEEQGILDMIERTLEAMAAGGIYDHVGFGFHRYSTDREWLLPHFEKMLYDQALLLMAYSEAAMISSASGYDSVVRDLSHFIVSELQDPSGGFYSAIDADSEGIEGKFYIWNWEELSSLLTQAEFDFVRDHFGVKKDGNFEEEAATGKLDGANILHAVKVPAQVPGSVQKTWSPIRQKLYQHRKKRIPPFLDDKVLSDWNGLMIAALARSSVVAGAGNNLEIAITAAEFLFSTMVRDGRLYRRWKDDDAAIDGVASDYSFLALGSIELYMQTFDDRWMTRAIELHEQLANRFQDEESGGFYINASDGESLLVRQKELHDGAIPSANSVALTNLIRLAHMTGQEAFMDQANRLLASMSESVATYPTGFAWMLLGIDHMIGPSVQVVIVGEPGADDTIEMHDALRAMYAPHVVGFFKPAFPDTASGDSFAPYTQSMKSIEGKATAYVCVDHVCELPTTDISQMQKGVRDSALIA